jgi:hypothetical protein
MVSDRALFHFCQVREHRPRNDGGETHFRILAARCARVLLEFSAPNKWEGAGNAGCPMHPQPRVRGSK